MATARIRGERRGDRPRGGWVRRARRGSLLAALLLGAALATGGVDAPLAHAAGGTDSTCTQASLQSDLTSGGVWLLDCPNAIAISASPLTFSDAGGDTTLAPASGLETVTLDGGGTTQILNVTDGTLTLDNLTFQHGNNVDNYGGAIENSGALTVSNSSFAGNSAFTGGAIEDFGTLTVSNSTFTGNSAANSGGAISNHGTLTVSNSTFTGNNALFGGAILSPTTKFSTAKVSVSASTFVGNSGGAIVIASSSGTATLRTTIIANNTCSGPITDGGGNLEYQGGAALTCGFGGTLNAGAGQDPLLGPLQDNGGPTQTMLPGAGSPAINAVPVSSGLCLATDQRGLPRPDNGETSCDIGAVEVQDIAATTLALTATPNPVVYGQPLTLTAIISPAATGTGGGAITGTVTFQDGSAIPGCASQPVDPTTGTATCTTTALDAGTHSLTASYSGDSAFAPSDDSAAPLSLTVDQAPQAITFSTTPPSPARVGASYAVAATGGASGQPVTFSAGPASVCTASGTNGAAISFVGAGTCTVTASQAGDQNYQAATATQTFTVTYPPLTLDLSVSSSPPGPVTTGSTVTASFALTNHTAQAQRITLAVALRYQGRYGTFSQSVTVRVPLKAGQTLARSTRFKIQRWLPRGTYTVSATATDPSGDTASGSASLTVS